MLPNFVLIGAPRSATTALHFALEQHPEVFVSSNKEPCWLLFDDAGTPLHGVHKDLIQRMRYRSVRTRPEYEALFVGAHGQHRAVGEASPAYMYFPAVAARIGALMPEARLLVILRQPVDQALSLYTVRQRGSVTEGAELVKGFIAKLETETADTSGYGLGLAEYGRYHRHLQPFFERFNRDQIRVMLTEDLETDQVAFFAGLFRFLGVDATFRPDLPSRINESGTARSVFVHRVLTGNQAAKRMLRAILPEVATRRLRYLQHRIQGANLERTHIISPNLRRDLTERFYGEQIVKLEAMLGRDLSAWRR